MIAVALNKPSTKAVFFNNFSVFMEISEGKKNLKIRLLAKGDFKSKITMRVAGASKSALAAVEKAGGAVILEQTTDSKS